MLRSLSCGCKYLSIDFNAILKLCTSMDIFVRVMFCLLLSYINVMNKSLSQQYYSFVLSKCFAYEFNRVHTNKKYFLPVFYSL